MARWKLMNAHYLNVDGEEWEYTENDRKTGRPVKRKFAVPRLLDPRDPACWNSRWGHGDSAEGEIIVCHEGKGTDQDIVFRGNPTPDMMPVDDEAKVISATFEKAWNYRPDNAITDFNQSMIDRFQVEMSAKASAPAEIPGMSDLVGAIKELVASNNGPAAAGRRV